VPEGAVLVLYTDGLVERRDSALDQGIDRVAASLTADDRPIAEVTSAIAGAVASHGGEDDIAILVARPVRDPLQRLAQLDLASEADSVRQARRFVSDRLDEWAVDGALAADAVLVASELVTNAVIHGKPPIQLRLHTAAGELTVEVDDGERALPHRLTVGAGAVHGRGLSIVAGLSTRWAARPNDDGKTVWSTLSWVQ
jgi:anti-sigma regulatory factor (Ser/Thr protein kinase)